MSAPPDPAPAASPPDGGSYEVIHRRLLEQAADLGSRADALNAKRKTVFGGTELSLIANERVRTENNCVPRDIISIAGHLLFGYRVFIGLKAETNVADVFSLHRFGTTADGFDLSPVPLTEGGGFLMDATFTKEFRDLFRYVREARLLQLRRTDTRLLALVQVGATVRDMKVFRWSVDASGRVVYMDARGEPDNVLPRAHDFEWTATTREDQIAGPHPHISVLDEVFVETIGGDLTVKVENNTTSGKGIYSEPVEDQNQTLDDAEIHYARLGGLILLRIRPFREKSPRFLVFNCRTKKVARIDAVGQACLQLPEDHGILFPGGYALQSGETKVFEGDNSDLLFERVIRSPNGEDVLYVFHRQLDGFYLLFPYNLIRKEVQTPIRCHGYSLFDDGKMVVFRADTDEPSRVHPMQVWQTPFATAEHVASAPTDGSYLAKVGNADLVRGISDAFSLRRLAETQSPTRQTFEDFISATSRMVDAYYWLGHAEVGDLLSVVSVLRKTSELIVDEFEKVLAIRKRAAEALATAETAQAALLRGLRPEALADVDGFMSALTSLRRQRGQLIGLRELRSVDLPRVDGLEAEVVAQFDTVSRACVDFLLKDAALRPLLTRLTELVTRVEAVNTAAEIKPLRADVDAVNEGLTLLSEVVAGLKIDDATARTRILEGISEVFAQLNRARATLQGRYKDLSTREGRAEFAAQFKLYGQSVTSALSLCDTPEKCDEQLSRLLVQLEELEGRFGEFDEFLGDLASKREEVNDAVGAKRQTLLDERQRRASNLASAAERILQGVGRRARTVTSADELNAYFASDAMVLKLGDLADQLLALGDTVRADEVRARTKAARQDALRGLRDRQDLYEDGASVIKLGRHKFSVQTQALELTLLPREGALCLHLTGTDFYEPVDDAGLNAAKDLWDQHLPSESPEVYRGEYLAATLLLDAEDGRGAHTVASLANAAVTPGGLLELVRAHTADRYDEGYERGLHDADGALILEQLLSLRAAAGLLRYAPAPRALASLYWSLQDADARTLLHHRARSLGRLRAQLSAAAAHAALATELSTPLATTLRERGFPCTESEARVASRYLIEELAADAPRFVTSSTAATLRDGLLAHLERERTRSALEDDLRALERHPAAGYQLCLAWLDAYARREPDGGAATLPYVPEAAALLLTDRKIDREISHAPTATTVTGLLGQHARIAERAMALRLDEFLGRLGSFVHERVPRYRAYRHTRQAVVERERKRLRVDEYAPRVLTSFVRNRLIDELYLPLVGANMAKQLGAVGDGKRTDLMGMLLLISPPGYGKTTLMEYVASKLGLVFMKVNGPALGHEVRSLDPADAPNATARQEVDKVNLALEMGNNVMLYLDDIQHTNPEFLQKFISLCDGQRRIEGVWHGRTRTYDLRGKKFCVVMAGNPYTESGAKFQIPDMLANRADTYNLGDILDGKEDIFALSYLENALTSNPTLAPLAGREPGDVHKLLRMARGEDIQASELSYSYSGAEIAEIVAVLQRLFRVQEVLLRVNQQYIASASQDDTYRTEPGFKLQGSYRNMNKVAEKVVAALNDAELDRLVDDHYAGESQTLTTGAEQNLLKLAELRGRMTPEQSARWAEIKEGFLRVKLMGGKDADPVTRVTGTLVELGKHLDAIRNALREAASEARNKSSEAWLAPQLAKLERALDAVARPHLDVAVRNEPGDGVAEVLAQQTGLIERTLVPLVRAATSRANERQSVNADDTYMPAVGAQLAELTQLVRTLDERVSAGAQAFPPAVQFETTLGLATPSNFYRGLNGHNVLEHGGLFVATHLKLPRPGTHVALNVVLPNGRALEVMGIVEWTRDPRESTPNAPPGFGARLRRVSPEVQRLISEYARLREPIFHDAV